MRKADNGDSDEIHMSPDNARTASNLVPKQVVTNILTYQGRVLLLLRSKLVGTFTGCWAGCSGFIEPDETPEQASYREIEEETGLKADNLTFLARGEPVLVTKPHGVWVIHPFLYATDSPNITLDWEHDDMDWVEPERVKELNTVPGLVKVIEELFEIADPS